MTTLPNPFDLNPQTLCLAIPSESVSPSAFSTTGAHWRSLLNQQSLASLLPWLREDQQQQPKVLPSRAALPSIWEGVNGTAIACGNLRLILIPTADLEAQELRVPQEWVDIPQWVGDYYVAVQVNPDAGWVQVGGYATHLQLKTQGTFDLSDRTYSLDPSDCIADINVLWVTHQLGLVETIRAAIAPLPTLSIAQARSLIERLGNPAVGFPRLAIPFPQWAALIQHDGWRQQLYQRRQGQTQGSLPQWLQSLVPGETVGAWQLAPLQWATQGMRSLPNRTLLKELTIADQRYALRIFPLPEQGGGLPVQSTYRAWRFELRRWEDETQDALVDTSDRLIPAGFKLRLLTEDLQPFEHNEDVAVEAIAQLYVDVMVEPDEGIVWEVEPTPEEYEREILKF